MLRIEARDPRQSSVLLLGCIFTGALGAFAGILRTLVGYFSGELYVCDRSLPSSAIEAVNPDGKYPKTSYLRLGPSHLFWDSVLGGSTVLHLGTAMNL